MIYQLRVSLEESNPEIWRTVLVPAEYTFDDLHIVIQVAMGWENAQLYQFHFGTPFASDYITADDDLELNRPPNGKHFKYDAQELTLEEYFGEGRKQVNYIYDFEDKWSHNVLLEATLNQTSLLPSCLAGDHACPPEECGGIFGYYDWLKIMNDPTHPSYNEYRELQALEEDEDYLSVYAFDKDETNEILEEVFSEEV